MAFSKFMASSAGRAIRIIAGLALIVVGGVLGGGWWALAVIGLIPLAAGHSTSACSTPSSDKPLSGKAVRAS